MEAAAGRAQLDRERAPGVAARVERWDAEVLQRLEEVAVRAYERVEAADDLERGVPQARRQEVLEGSFRS